MITMTLATVFVAAFGLVVGTYVFLSRRTLAQQAAARRRVRQVQLVGSAAGRLWRDNAASAIPLLSDRLAKLAHTKKLSKNIRAAGLEARPATIILSAVVLAGTGLLTGNMMHGSLLLGTVYGGLGLAAPYLYVRWKRQKRIEKFESQLTEAIDLLINAMRAGYSFQAGMELVGQELPDPLGGEFAQFYEEQRLGIELRAALLALQERVDSLDLKMFITAVLIQRETGGNLSEVLGNISHVIRERGRIKGELKTLTSQVRLSAAILGLMPIVVVFLITLVNPMFIAPLFKEPVGRMMLVGAGVAQLLGFATMRKIANIEI